MSCGYKPDMILIQLALNSCSKHQKKLFVGIQTPWEIENLSLVRKSDSHKFTRAAADAVLRTIGKQNADHKEIEYFPM